MNKVNLKSRAGTLRPKGASQFFLKLAAIIGCWSFFAPPATAASSMLLDGPDLISMDEESFPRAIEFYGYGRVGKNLNDSNKYWASGGVIKITSTKEKAINGDNLADAAADLQKYKDKPRNVKNVAMIHDSFSRIWPSGDAGVMGQFRPENFAYFSPTPVRNNITSPTTNQIQVLSPNKIRNPCYVDTSIDKAGMPCENKEEHAMLLFIDSTGFWAKWEFVRITRLVDTITIPGGRTYNIFSVDRNIWNQPNVCDPQLAYSWSAGDLQYTGHPNWNNFNPVFGVPLPTGTYLAPIEYRDSGYYLNYSTKAPVPPPSWGKTAVWAHADWIADWFEDSSNPNNCKAPDYAGNLRLPPPGYFGCGYAYGLDGIEFDNFVVDWRAQCDGPRGWDLNFDGIDDCGYFGGELTEADKNTFAKGANNFLEKLRERLGSNKVIMGDHNEPNMQRNVTELNGVENEGLSSIKDWNQSSDKSLNRFNLWKSLVNHSENNNKSMNYLVVKDRPSWATTTNCEKPTSGLPPEFRGNMTCSQRQRYGLGVATVVGGVMAKNQLLESDYPMTELDKGANGDKNTMFWLGAPVVSPGVPSTIKYLTKLSTEKILADPINILDNPVNVAPGAYPPSPGNDKFIVSNATVTEVYVNNTWTQRFENIDSNEPMVVRIRNIQIGSSAHFTVFLSAIAHPADPTHPHPFKIEAKIYDTDNESVQVAFNGYGLFSRHVVNENVFHFNNCKKADLITYTFNCSSINKVDLEFTIDKSLRAFSIHKLVGYANALMYAREFQNGVVLVNDDQVARDFDLNSIIANPSSVNLKRLTARPSVTDEASINNGANVPKQSGGNWKVPVNARDALFLIKY